ncbi:hypothetical protein AX14_014415, partial [Amanita brunnescens Koide BX004]
GRHFQNRGRRRTVTVCELLLCHVHWVACAQQPESPGLVSVWKLSRDACVQDAVRKKDLDCSKWTNPLELRLPYVPSIKIFCACGHWKETEVNCPPSAFTFGDLPDDVH